MDAFLRLTKLDQVAADDYVRVSHCLNGESTSPVEQHEEHEARCTEYGWRLTRTYEDKISASKYGRKQRPDFEELLSDLKSGRFTSQVLMLWESSQGSRKTGEWITSIELCEERGVYI